MASAELSECKADTYKMERYQFQFQDLYLAISFVPDAPPLITAVAPDLKTPAMLLVLNCSVRDSIRFATASLMYPIEAYGR